MWLAQPVSTGELFDVEVKPVLVPSEIELDQMTRQRQHGIKIDAELLALLRQHGAHRPS